MDKQMKMTIQAPAILLSALLSTCAAKTSAEPIGRVYSVCELGDSDTPASSKSVGGVNRSVHVIGDVGRTFHSGVILVDNSCPYRRVRIIFPSPDTGNVQEKFRFLYDAGGTSGSFHYRCDCVGRIRFLRGEWTLYIESANITAIPLPDK